MKKSIKNLAFSAALVATAVTFTSCRNSEQAVYGPPPQDYDASENVEEDVYGPPQESGETSNDESDIRDSATEIDVSANIPNVVYGPPTE